MPQTDAEFPGGSDTASARYQANARSTLLAYLLWFFLGWLGVHRFYLGRVFSGIIMLLPLAREPALPWSSSATCC